MPNENAVIDEELHRYGTYAITSPFGCALYNYSAKTENFNDSSGKLATPAQYF